MGEPYTPSTEEVREAWVVHQGHDILTAQDLLDGYETFERFIASVRAEAEAKGRAEAEADRDALAAKLDKVREWASVNEIAPVPLDWRGIGAILSTAPADVLAERDARIRKQALRDIYEVITPRSTDHDGEDVLDRLRNWLRARTTEAVD